jgi:hypothetical protein
MNLDDPNKSPRINSVLWGVVLVLVVLFAVFYFADSSEYKASLNLDSSGVIEGQLSDDMLEEIRENILQNQY